MILAWLLVSLCFAADGGVGEAVTALQRGDFAGAEQILRAEVAAHPDEAIALSLLGVALDGQKKGAGGRRVSSKAPWRRARGMPTCSAITAITCRRQAMRQARASSTSRRSPPRRRT